MYSHNLSGPVETQAAEALSNVLSKALAASVYGKPGSPEQKDRAEFYSLVLSRTGEKFVVSEQGQKVVNKFVWFGVVPAFVLGLAAGYLLFKKS